MDLPAVVRSAHTWDTKPGCDLRKGEEAIVVSVVEHEDFASTWTLIPLEQPRLLTIRIRGDANHVLRRKWLTPA